MTDAAPSAARERILDDRLPRCSTPAASGRSAST